jgi:hypothetical protein
MLFLASVVAISFAAYEDDVFLNIVTCFLLKFKVFGNFFGEFPAFGKSGLIY